MPDADHIWLTIALLVLIHVLAVGLVLSIVQVSHRPARSAARRPVRDSGPREGRAG